MEQLLRFWTEAAGSGPLEWIAVLTGFACVWLAARESLWNFPVAIVSCGLYVFVYRQSTLYADMGLQVVFIILALYGWYQWLHGGQNRAELPVSRTTRQEWVGCAVFVAVFTLAVGYYLQHHTDAALPHWDAFTTAGSLAGQFLLIRKRLENWFIWIVVDIIYVPILWYKQLYPTSALYALYLALAVYGYVEWRRALRKNATRSVPLSA
ncbi:nicotinamide riboside transporter PnuC [Hymenobacter psychrophilus]|uniref:Nicotinamide riboside transporter PnuC n=1 Tax=Hymenobacter psychrophilus TaxID=651662 RepID=A0A1H3ME31_9BACT|nr:nicotinamide riboside transporter PnuC [Hymenobacter psychrophilus]SDY74449.1 nicotinamide mononucleotide transporter [Hymenobacter psychrophilus]